MFISKPPMGWNSWNTFGPDISDKLIRETADAMIEGGYLDAGYEYLVIDDCWSERERDENGRLVPDHIKFPNGMKAVADYVHSKGLKFGMYSCAGTRTCANYPGSFDHEFVDAQTFAEWGVDFLKYDFCFFPKSANCIQRYHTMSMALKASGRDILFSACNWGVDNPGSWMRSIGVHMYRSTGDIFDNFTSFKDIFVSQIDKLCFNAPHCFNDIDMMIVGMYGKGNVSHVGGCTDTEYKTHFALWCLAGVPLMIGGDLRNMNAFSHDLLCNKELIAINQDPECRPPHLIDCRPPFAEGIDVHSGRGSELPVFIRHMADDEFVIGYFNFTENRQLCQFTFVDAGIPYSSGVGLEMTNVFTGENVGVQKDYYNIQLDPHDCALYRAKLVSL